MIFGKFGATLLSLLTIGRWKNPRVKRGSVLKRQSPFAELDALFTPRLTGSNYPAASRGGHFKANQRQERKISAKKRVIAAHRKAAKKAKDKEKTMK